MKIVCPFCENINEVDNGALHVSCSKCGQSFTIQDGKKKTLNKYKELQNFAYASLYHTQNFQDALDCYEELLNIKPNDLSSINGYCVAKICLSTFENVHFKFIIDEIEQYDIVLNVENSNLYLHFVKDILTYIEIYYDEVNSRLLKNNVFINKKYLEDYLEENKEIIELMNYFNDSFPLVDEEEFNMFKTDFPTFMERIDDILKKANTALNSSYNVNHIGEVEVKDGKINVLGTNVINLDIDEVLNFNIIIENTKGKFLTKVFLPICGGFGVLTLIFFIVFGALKEALYLYLAIGALVICAIVYAVYQILLRKTFKK